MALSRPGACLTALVVCAAIAGCAALRPGAAAAARSMRARQQDRYTLDAERDRVEALPGAPPLEFGMFAGNVSVDDAAGRSLFYVFVERDVDPADAPLILWLNGGPGCSSLGGGFMSELGPFFPHKGGRQLKQNPYAWNRGLANVLFLESPAFVGFSFSKRPQDAIVGDARTASDARVFLLRWLERFPQYARADLFVSGESYGGHYVPNLAREIVRGNRRPRDAKINLRGILVGNAWTDPEIDNKGTLDFWYSHALISDEDHEGIHKACNFSNIGPLARGAHALSLGRDAGLRPGRLPAGSLQAAAGANPAALQRAADEECDALVQEAFDTISGINIYDIYADVCDPDPAPEPPIKGAKGQAAPHAPWRGALLGEDTPPANRGAGASPGPKKPSAAAAAAGTLKGGPAAGARGAVGYPHPGRIPRYDPCIDNKVEVYFNLPEVQSALHANQSGDLPGPWQDCTREIDYSRRDLLTSMLPVWRELIAEGDLQLWVFSGDVDGIVPVLGTRRWVASLELPVEKGWRPWQSQTGQVAGWRVDYTGLTMLSVRNAGHMVPYVQPERAYQLVADFLEEAGSLAPPSAA